MGEFVELSELLPSVSCSVPHARTQNVLRFESSDGGPLRVVEDGAARGKSRHVHDLATWVEAYTIMSHVIVDVARTGQRSSCVTRASFSRLIADSRLKGGWSMTGSSASRLLPTRR